MRSLMCAVCSSHFVTTLVLFRFLVFFFFNVTATTEIYTLSLHDALPISFSTIATKKGVINYNPTNVDYSAHPKTDSNKFYV